ncbi:MAG: RagB/SusD family nutrient uptake outer membrane protein [Longimicrobiales bacterium]
MDVDNPTMIQDEDLNTMEAVTAITTGAAGDFAQAMIVPGGGGLITAGAMLSDELVHVGTWIGLRGLSDGQSHDDWVESQSRWAEPSQARWVAENAIGRLSGIFEDQGENPEVQPEVAEVTMWAGFSNKALGDHFCEAVIDGGPSQPVSAFYERAEDYFNTAITRANSAGASAMVTASYAGRAHTRMMLGDWAGAVSDAAMVPTNFVYYMYYHETAGVQNMMYWWGYLRDETSVWGTPFETLGLNLVQDNGGDPRVPYDYLMEDGSIQDGGDARRPFYRQRKYTGYGQEIPLTKGTEMRLIEAEAALMSSDYNTAVSKINEVRNFNNSQFGYELPEVSAASLEEAWQLLMTERGLELWLEGKRLADLRRWAETRNGDVPFPVVREEARGQPASADPIRPVLETDVMSRLGDLCIQISKNEKTSNKNLK